MSSKRFKIGILEQSEDSGELLEAQLDALGQSKVRVFRSAKLLMTFLESNSLDKIFISSPVKDFHWLTFLRSLSSSSHGSNVESVLILEENEKIQHDWLDLIRSYGVTEVLRKPLDVNRLRVYFDDKIKAKDAQKEESQQKLNRLRAAYKKGLQQVVDETRVMLTEEKYSTNRDKLFKESSLDKVADEMQSLISFDPENYNFHFELLAFYLEAGRTEQFNQLLDHLLREISGADRGYWLVELADLCFEKGFANISEFISDIVESECAPRHRVRTKLIRAHIQLSNGDIESAGKFVQEASRLASEPTVEVLKLQAIVARKQQKFQEALGFWRAAEKICSFDHRIPYQIALCFKNLGEMENAVLMAKESLKIYPKFKKANNLISALSVS